MCYFVTVGMDESQEWRLRSRGFEVCRSRHSRLVCALKQSAFEVTLGGCACDFWPHQKRDVEKRIYQKGKRRGWSTNRTLRAIEHALKVARPRTGAAWRDFLDGLADIHTAGSHVSLYAHLYVAGVTDESLKLSEELGTTLAELAESAPEDVILRLSPPPRLSSPRGGDRLV